MIIIFLGPPGAGKGTQAKLVAKELKVPHISTGDIYRDHIKRQDEIGKKVKALLDAGHFAPSEMTNAMMSERLSEDDCKGGYVLDGYPRNIEQALYYQLHIVDEPDHVINIKVPDEETVKRIKARAKEGRADDANEDLIRERIKVYNKETRPCIKFYEDQDVLRNVNGVGAVEDIFLRIKSII